MTHLIYCSPEQLKIHPENIRAYYPPGDVAEMAASIRAMNGVLQALLVIYDDAPDHYLVVDGNLRLMAGRLLGPECPPLKCEVIAADHARQLLVMAATGLHYPKDPVSEGRHYRRLVSDEGYSVEEIARRTGISRATIDSRMALLELDEDIQRLVVEGRISKDIRVTRALRAIPDPATRVKLARRFAANGTGIPRIVKSCRVVLEQGRRMKGEPAKQDRPRPQVALVKPAPQARLGAELARVIGEAAEKTLCEGCRVDGLSAECYLCPGPQEFIDHLLMLAEGAEADALHAAA